MWRGIGLVLLLAAALTAAMRLPLDVMPAASSSGSRATAPREDPVTSITAPAAVALTEAPRPARPSDARSDPRRHREAVAGIQLQLYQAVYDQDEDALARVVASPRMRLDALAAMADGRIRFLEAPSSENVAVSVDEVLLDRADCVVLVVSDDVTGLLDTDSPSLTLIVVYWLDAGTGRFRIASRWAADTPRSVWQADCDLQERGEHP